VVKKLIVAESSEVAKSGPELGGAQGGEALLAITIDK